jgi:hypothetical protein
MMAEQETGKTFSNPPRLPALYIVASKEFLWRKPPDAADAAKN